MEMNAKIGSKRIRDDNLPSFRKDGIKKPFTGSSSKQSSETPQLSMDEPSSVDISKTLNSPRVQETECSVESAIKQVLDRYDERRLEKKKNLFVWKENGTLPPFSITPFCPSFCRNLVTSSVMLANYAQTNANCSI